jgi:hypothetical protein
MKTSIALFVWALCLLLAAATAPVVAAASEKQPVLGPYHSEARARAAAERLGHYGWTTRVSGRRCWYVHVQWAAAAGIRAGSSARGTAVPNSSTGHAHDVQARDRGTKDTFSLKAGAVSDLQDGDWQINAGRVRLWTEGRAKATGVKRPGRHSRPSVSR